MTKFQQNAIFILLFISVFSLSLSAQESRDFEVMSFLGSTIGYGGGSVSITEELCLSFHKEPKENIFLGLGVKFWETSELDEYTFNYLYFAPFLHINFFNFYTDFGKIWCVNQDLSEDFLYPYTSFGYLWEPFSLRKGNMGFRFSLDWATTQVLISKDDYIGDDWSWDSMTNTFYLLDSIKFSCGLTYTL